MQPTPPRVHCSLGFPLTPLLEAMSQHQHTRQAKRPLSLRVDMFGFLPKEEKRQSLTCHLLSALGLCPRSGPEAAWALQKRRHHTGQGTPPGALR